MTPSLKITRYRVVPWMIIHPRFQFAAIFLPRAIVSPERSTAFIDAEVIIRDGRIAAIAKSSRVGSVSARRRSDAEIDGRGLYLVLGLVDSHVHLGSIPGMTAEQERARPDIARAARKQIPRSFLSYGFTTLVDLDSAPDRMVLWKKHPLVPDTYFCGAPAVMDGYPMNWEPKPARYQGCPYLGGAASGSGGGGIRAYRRWPTYS